MNDSLKNEDEPIPRPRVGSTDPSEVPGQESDAVERTETNLNLDEPIGDGEVLPDPIEQQQEREALDAGNLSGSESAEDKADDIINGGILGA